jgi:DNA-directed RNA polymerase subunit delta
VKTLCSEERERQSLSIHIETTKTDAMVPFKKAQPSDDYAADNSGEMSHEDEDNDSNDDDDDDDEAVEGNPMEEESDSEDAEGMEEEESSDEDEGEEEKRAAANSLQINPVASATGESCTFDLRNLLAMNVHQVSSATLYSASNKAKKTASDENITIAPSGLGVFVNEDYILEKATDGCAQLLGALWQLPMTRSDAGPMAFLPSYDEIKIPRALVSSSWRESLFICSPSVKDEHTQVLTHSYIALHYRSLLHPRNERQSGRSLPKKRASH